MKRKLLKFSILGISLLFLYILFPSIIEGIKWGTDWDVNISIFSKIIDIFYDIPLKEKSYYNPNPYYENLYDFALNMLWSFKLLPYIYNAFIIIIIIFDVRQDILKSKIKYYNVLVWIGYLITVATGIFYCLMINAILESPPTA